MTHSIRLIRSILLPVSISLLGACVSVGIGIPLGPFGTIGLGVNGAGQITGNLGIMGHLGAVGIGAGTSIPLGSIAPAPTHPPQTGASQNVPR